MAYCTKYSLRITEQWTSTQVVALAYRLYHIDCSYRIRYNLYLNTCSYVLLRMRFINQRKNVREKEFHHKSIISTKG
jgi:hypothetical protein